MLAESGAWSAAVPSGTAADARGVGQVGHWDVGAGTNGHGTRDDGGRCVLSREHSSCTCTSP